MKDKKRIKKLFEEMTPAEFQIEYARLYVWVMFRRVVKFFQSLPVKWILFIK